MSHFSDTIKFPKGHTAYIFGSATAGWMQQVVVKVQNTSGSDLNECSFQGLDGPMAITSGGLGFVNQQAIVIPADNRENRRLELIFSAYDSNMWAADDAEEIEGFQKDPQISTVVPWVKSYIYRTEDGGDNDYDDTTFVVTLIANTKQVQPNGWPITQPSSSTSSPTGLHRSSHSHSRSHPQSRSRSRSRSHSRAATPTVPSPNVSAMRDVPGTNVPKVPSVNSPIGSRSHSRSRSRSRATAPTVPTMRDVPGINVPKVPSINSPIGSRSHSRSRSRATAPTVPTIRDVPGTKVPSINSPIGSRSHSRSRSRSHSRSHSRSRLLYIEIVRTSVL